MKKLLLITGLLVGSQATHTAPAAVVAAPAKSVLDKALEIVPKAVLYGTSCVGVTIANHPGKSLAVMGALSIVAYEKYQTLKKRNAELTVLARTPVDNNGMQARQQAITRIENTHHQVTLTLSPLSWIYSIINAFVGLRANQ